MNGIAIHLFLKPKVILDLTSICGNNKFSWLTNPIFRFSGFRLIRLSELNTVLQPIFISPLFGVKLPDRQFNNVLLPAPEGPNNTVIPLHVFPETDRVNSPRVIMKSNNIIKSHLYVLIFLRPFWARRL